MSRFLISIILFVGCGQQSAKDQHSNGQQFIGDSVVLAQVETDTSESKTATEEVVMKGLPEGNRVFLDKVHVFQNTNEPYVWVGLKEGYSWRAIDTLKNHCDSVLYSEGEEFIELRRSRFPMDKARKYLNLDLLDGITLFNYNHQKIGKTSLKRIEYYEDAIGAQFVAVLEPNGKLIGDQFYGVNGTDDFVPRLTSKVITNSQLKDKIKQIVNVNVEFEWDFESIHVKPFDLTYTYYSVATDQGEKTYLFESKGNDIKLMTEITNDYSIMDLTPVCLQQNGRPILLLWVGPPETDIEWFTPAVFNGKGYEITNNRILVFPAQKKKTTTLNQQSKFNLTGFKRFSDYPSSDPDTAKCKEWSLTAAQIEEILKNVEPISGPDWHHLFGHYPCTYRGLISQSGREFKVEINSGSWLTISSDTTVYYGDLKGKFRNWFQDGVWDQDSE